MRDWNPDLYLKYEPERVRAAADLLGRTPEPAPGLGARPIYDLGGGGGASALLLSRRFPGARIVVVDNSPAMLARAKERLPDVEFVEADLARWRPPEPPAMLFANSSLHFLPEHEALFPRLVKWLPPGGVLAAQMPDLARETALALLRMAAVDGPWAKKLLPIAKSLPILPPLERYYSWLAPLCDHLDLWGTTYLHRLDGPQGVVDWYAGSVLRPYLGELSPDEGEQFLARYRRDLARDHPMLEDGSALLAYPRLFVVARKTL